MRAVLTLVHKGTWPSGRKEIRAGRPRECARPRRSPSGHMGWFPVDKKQKTKTTWMRNVAVGLSVLHNVLNAKGTGCYNNCFSCL